LTLLINVEFYLSLSTSPSAWKRESQARGHLKFASLKMKSISRVKSIPRLKSELTFCRIKDTA